MKTIRGWKFHLAGIGSGVSGSAFFLRWLRNLRLLEILVLIDLLGFTILLSLIIKVPFVIGKGLFRKMFEMFVELPFLLMFGQRIPLLTVTYTGKVPE